MSLLLSVIVPVYNAGAYLNKCLESILCQNCAQYELLLVDDGSTDGSGALCDSLAAADGRVRVIHKENGGQASARKEGIAAAKGDYITYVDADDCVRPDWLEVICSCLEAGGYPDLLAFGIEEHGPSGNKQIISDLPEGLYSGQRLKDEVFPYAVCDRRRAYTTQLIYPVAWNKVYRRSLLSSHYCTDLRIRRGEDMAFVYECVLSCSSLYVSHAVLYDYDRNIASSISGRYGLRLTENDVWLAEYLRKRLAPFGVERQINDLILSKIIRSVYWKASNMQPREAAAALKDELRQTGLLGQMHLGGLPPVPAAFLLALKAGLYGPLISLAGRRAKRLRSGGA